MNVFKNLAERVEGAAERAARLASRGARGRRLPRWALYTATILGLAVAVAWLALRFTSARGDAEIETARRAVDGLRKIGRQIGGLEALERPADDRLPGPVVAEISRTLPKNLWLDRVATDRVATDRVDQITLEGRTSDLDALADWLEYLIASPLFSDVELGQVVGDHDDPDGRSRPASSARPSYRFRVVLAAVFSGEPSTDTGVVPGPLTVPAAASPPAAGPAAGAATPRGDPLPALFQPLSTAGARGLPTSDWLAEVAVDEVEILGIYQTSFGAVARARCARRDGVLAIRTGDRLNDGEVAWIGFFSPRLAAVRLEQRQWPPRCTWQTPVGCDGKPYREVFRVLGWDSILDREARREPVPGKPLQVVGRQGLGSWPDEGYSNVREVMVETVGGERLPRVDLFAAVFHEMYGLFPWQHPSWRRRGWTVEMGLPWLGSIADLAQVPAVPGPAGSRPDPFRSLLGPWSQRPFFGPTRRPGGLAGLPIDETELVEIYRTARGWVAEIEAAGSFRPLTLRQGDRLWDGEVIAVRSREVIFKQTVKDPLALKPFREVVRRLDRGGVPRSRW